MAVMLQSLLNTIVGSISGTELSRRLGKSPSYISQMRSGSQIPTPETLTILAHEFDAVSRLPELLLAALHDEIEQLSFKDPSQGHLKESLLNAIKQLSPSIDPTPVIRTSGRTFRDFPDSFYPMAIVTGDKREDRENNITVGDLGVYAATPGDTRWLLNLGLHPDVIKHVDKSFVLLSEDELIKEFAEVNLVVIGSPASNHLARFINSSAVFRFNYSPAVENAINEIIIKAVGLSPAELVGYRGRERNGLVALNRLLFAGGIIDPTAEDYLAATYAQLPVRTYLDFGLLSFAANPYYVLKCKNEGRVCDHKYVSIMAAGIHHPATAHALRLLGRDCRRDGVFDRHPYGGVIRVKLDLNLPFSKRTMEATWEWEDVADKARRPSDDQKKLLVDQLGIIEKKLGKRELKGLALDEKQTANCRTLIENL